jgi:hypothetical protein
MSVDGSAYRLAVVGSGRVRGQIAMVACPGRMAGIAIPTTSAWRLQRDVATLKHWGAQALVTLLEKSELALMRLAGLPVLLEARKIAWYHLPLPDGCVPDERFEALWQGVAPRLRSALWCGGRIAMHCVALAHRDGDRQAAGGAGLPDPGCVEPRAQRAPARLASAEEEQFIRRQARRSKPSITQLSLAQPLGRLRARTPGRPVAGLGPAAFEAPDRLELRTPQVAGRR